MAYVAKTFTYLGIDETSLGLGNQNLIVAAAETHKKTLAKDKGWRALKKAKDFLEEAKEIRRKEGEYPQTIFPPYSELETTGLENFHWTRATGGRFSRQIIEHASLAFIVATNGYNPQRTILLIDAFHSNHELSRYLIKEYLNRQGFNIPRRNIEIHGGGDRSVPIINYADLIAFQIGLALHEKYRQWHPDRLTFPIRPSEIPYDEKRVMSIDEEGRSQLEEVLKSWKGHS